jgi:hypothetical protein
VVGAERQEIVAPSDVGEVIVMRRIWMDHARA